MMSTGSNAARTLNWAQVDVFAERALEGNMLAIFTDARGLTGDEMQALARETNLSETTFIVPGDPDEEAREGVRVRIFTVEEELPFAGHPTLGTASWLWANHPTLQGADEVKLKLDAGTIPVRFTQPAAGEQGVFGEMRQRDPEFGDELDAATVAEFCGVTEEDLHPSLKPQVVSTGLPFGVIALRSTEALSRLRVKPEMRSFLKGHDAKFPAVIAPTHDPATWRVRMQLPWGGEDPATGSAAGCSISYLVRHGAVASGAGLVFQQGIEIQRPSKLYVRASLLTGTTVTDVFVAGRTIPVASGVFMLP